MQNKRWKLLPALALIVVGCADAPTAPTAAASLDGVTATFSDHTYEQGNTVRGHWAPEVDVEVLGSQVELCATWIDFSNFDETDPHVYSFDVEILDDEEWTKLGSAGGQGSPWYACFTTDALEDGTYSFRVKGMANVPTGGTPPFSPHHTEYWEGEVTVGEELRFVVFLRDAPRDRVEHETFNRNAGTWTIHFLVQVWDADADDFADVTDCSDELLADLTAAAVWDTPSSASGAFELSGCEAVGAMDGAAIVEGKVSNAFHRASSAGELVFTIDGTTNENTVTFSTN